MKILDEAHIEMLAGDDASVLLGIIGDYKEDAHQILKRCSGAVESGNVVLFKRLIHQLKGSSGSLGFTACYESCVALELVEDDEGYTANIAELGRLVDESVKLASGLLG